MSLLGILNIGRQGLVTSQTALSVTSQNISNVDSEGYTRQKATLASLPGGGATVSSIQRLRNEYVVRQVRDSNARLGAATTLASNLSTIETVLGDAETCTVSNAISDFFDALQDLTLSPGGSTERESFRSQSTQLASSFNSLSTQLGNTVDQLNDQVKTSVDEINSLTGQIAKLNARIGNLGGKAGNADGEINQLLDQRDQLVDQLSSYVDLNVVEDGSGSYAIFGGSEVLVEGTNQHELSTTVDLANGGLLEVTLTDAAGNTRSLNAALTTGTLGAQVESRNDAQETLDSIDKLAASFIVQMNAQHAAGTGLDGVSGRDLFTGLAVTAAPSWKNDGAASITASSIADTTQLTTDDYEIRFTAAGQYDVVDTTSGATLLSNQTYTSGSAITFAGMSLTLSDTAGVGPAAGDVYTVNSYSGTSERMAVSADVQNNLNAIAAGTTANAGDNSNATLMANLQNSLTMGNPASKTFDEYLDATRLKVSIAVESANTTLSSEETENEELATMADSVSGVSIDEEAINLLSYQRAFEAASRIVNTVNEMMETLIQMV